MRGKPLVKQRCCPIFIVQDNPCGDMLVQKLAPAILRRIEIKRRRNHRRQKTRQTEKWKKRPNQSHTQHNLQLSLRKCPPALCPIKRDIYQHQNHIHKKQSHRQIGLIHARSQMQHTPRDIGFGQKNNQNAHQNGLQRNGFSYKPGGFNRWICSLCHSSQFLFRQSARIERISATASRLRQSDIDWRSASL